MVQSASCGDTASHIFIKNKGGNGRSNCISCKDYEIQLKEALNKLSSAHLIIKPLQNELQILTTSKNADSNGLVSTSKTGVCVDNIKEWTLVNSEKHIEKSNKRNKGEAVSMGYLTMTSNHFTKPHNLKDNQTDPKKDKNVVSGLHQQNTYGKSINNIIQVFSTNYNKWKNNK
jgi:hypothetical protein